MALLHPDWTTIQKSHQPPTEGELTFLRFLEANLKSDEYEIYFQPYLNGDRPDIVLMRKGGGVLIIEVKDYDLGLYSVDQKTKWHVRTKEGRLQPIQSPFQQVFHYKENMFDLHSGALKAGKMSNPNTYYVVNCAVFFSVATYSEFERLAINPFKNKSTDVEPEDDSYQKYLKFLSYFEVYTKDTLSTEKLHNHLHKCWVSRESRLFENNHYVSLKRYLMPPYHYEKEGRDIIYTLEQKKLVISEAGKRQKIKGVAGCGKTFVLAKRAVNAHLRTGERVLILTYNLSLVNYIRDRIKEVKADFPWTAFHIVNYHQFFKSEANNYGLQITDLSCWDNPKFFEPVKDEISKYKAVFIDEVQDYKLEWFDLLNAYFVHPDAELVVFGDEKQNIYDRPLEEKQMIVARQMPGRWNQSLRNSIRFTTNIAKLAARFQQAFLGRKYSLEEIGSINQGELGFVGPFNVVGKIDYFHLNSDATAQDYFNIIKGYVTQHGIHSSDVAVLGATVTKIREIDFLIRSEMKEKTIATFENQEYFDKNKPPQKELEKLRRMKKLYFFMKTGTMKLSTIHSFKGWEIPTLFVVIDDLETNASGFTSHELIYTAITRAKQNLIILNAASDAYHEFFLKENDGKVSEVALEKVQ